MVRGVVAVCGHFNRNGCKGDPVMSCLRLASSVSCCLWSCLRSFASARASARCSLACVRMASASALQEPDGEIAGTGHGVGWRFLRPWAGPFDVRPDQRPVVHEQELLGEAFGFGLALQRAA